MIESKYSFNISLYLQIMLKLFEFDLNLAAYSGIIHICRSIRYRAIHEIQNEIGHSWLNFDVEFSFVFNLSTFDWGEQWVNRAKYPIRSRDAIQEKYLLNSGIEVNTEHSVWHDELKCACMSVVNWNAYICRYSHEVANVNNETVNWSVKLVTLFIEFELQIENNFIINNWSALPLWRQWR